MSIPRSDPTVPNTQPDVLIIGLGNLLLTDEGLGVHILRRLEQRFTFAPPVAMVDGGTTGLDLLPLFKEHKRILLIDALVSQDLPAGRIQVLRNTEILTALSKKLSMHHLGLCDVLALASLLDYHPDEIVLIGMPPRSLELGTELSPELSERIPDLFTAVQDILTAWDVEMRPLPAIIQHA